MALQKEKRKTNQLYRFTTCCTTMRHALSTRPWLHYVEAGGLFTLQGFWKCMSSGGRPGKKWCSRVCFVQSVIFFWLWARREMMSLSSVCWFGWTCCWLLWTTKSGTGVTWFSCRLEWVDEVLIRVKKDVMRACRRWSSNKSDLAFRTRRIHLLRFDGQLCRTLRTDPWQ
jgi:hypothetical protein